MVICESRRYLYNSWSLVPYYSRGSHLFCLGVLSFTLPSLATVRCKVAFDVMLMLFHDPFYLIFFFAVCVLPFMRSWEWGRPPVSPPLLLPPLPHLMHPSSLLLQVRLIWLCWQGVPPLWLRGQPCLPLPMQPLLCWLPHLPLHVGSCSYFVLFIKDRRSLCFL